MGLMPAKFEILANGNDITKLISDRLIRLVINDVHGEKSDTVEIEIDNRDLLVELPSTGAELSIAIGFGDELVDKGLYQVDELEEPLDEDKITIHGKASKIKQSFKAPRSENYDDITIGDLVALIAGRHGFKASVSSSLSVISYEHINQEAESDMNLLTRLGRENGALVKPISNNLLFVTKDESKSASGKAIAPIIISDAANSTGRVNITERNNYESVKAYWYDEEKSERQEVTIGNGEPIYTIRRHYKDAEKCQAAAEAKLRSLKRGTKSLELSRPLMPEAIAEGPLIIKEHKASANGDWVIEDVTHTIADGQVATSEFTLHLPK